MGALNVYALRRERPRLVGTIDTSARAFSYAPTYVSGSGSFPLSLSLPLRAEPYDEKGFRPYFDGLIPEGDARASIAGELGIAEGDYLALLDRCGRECIGDVLVLPSGLATPALPTAFYEPVGYEELIGVFQSPRTVARENASARLSLAGTQDKLGLARNPSTGVQGPWLRPRGLAASTHILKTSYLRDVPELEFLCMRAAAACGINVAAVELYSYGRPVLAVERFDRTAGSNDELHVARRHQEDLAQALGIMPTSKYAELESGTVFQIASLIRSRSTRPLPDLTLFAQLLLFNYLIGNCDAHLKNYSLLWDEHGLRLAPGYDLVCTTYFPRFNRSLAMALGGERSIDAVTPQNLAELARDLGVSVTWLRGACRGWPGVAREAISAAAESDEALASTPSIAEDLIDDMAPRSAVIERFARGL